MEPVFTLSRDIIVNMRIASEGAAQCKDNCLDEEQRFSLWARNIGALSHETDPGSLEKRLEDAKHVLDHVRKILYYQVQITSDLAKLCTNSGPHNEENPSELNSLLQECRECTQKLFRISRMIRKAAASDPFQRALDNSTLYTGLYLQYAIQHVGDKFNKLNEKHAVWLRDRLGEAISQRKQYLTYVEEHRDRLMTAAESTVNLRLDGPALPAPVPDDARTKATTLKPAAPIISLDMIHDGSREAFDDDAKSETTMALTTDEGSKSIRLTRIMKLADVETSSQGEVQCPYCTYIGSFRSQKSWERHIYSDLKAYVCTYKECKEPLFSNKQAWFKHELDVHRSYYCCAVCAGQDRLTETTYIEHLQQHHPVLLEASPFSAILSISRVAPTSFRTNDCPLCSDYSYKYDFGQNRTLRQFRDHVANHLEQLALFALPNLATADDEDEEQEIDRSSPVADDSASEFDTHEEQDQQGIDSWLVTDSSPVQSYHMLEDSDHPPDVTIGGEHEAATANMENMENMGFARADIDAAMRDTSSDPDRAIELLLARIGDGADQDQAQPARAETPETMSTPTDVDSRKTSDEREAEAAGPTTHKTDSGPYLGLKPAFVIQIAEISESIDAPQYLDAHNRWVPVTLPNSYRRNGTNRDGSWWFANGMSISALKCTSCPNGASLYKTSSLFYSDGFGFHVLRGDATQPSSNEHWRALTFNHDENDYSSSVCHVGSHPTMRCHKPSTSWPEMLLPSIYHGPDTSHDGYGGLIGELPIFLALITFSMQPQELPNVLPQIFRNGQWATHSLKHRRNHKRGLVVSVYAYNNNHAELEDYEVGKYGKFYN